MKTWRTIVVLGAPAAATILLWWALGTQLNARLSAAEFDFFGNKTSLEAVGPTAVYFVLLVIAAQLNPLDLDELMPIRRRLRGTYAFKLVSNNPLDGELHIQIDKQSKRLSIHGKTKKGNALVVSGRIFLRTDYLGFVMDAVPVPTDGDDTGARYFIECDLTADTKVPFAPDNKWWRIDGDGYGSLQIARA